MSFPRFRSRAARSSGGAYFVEGLEPRTLLSIPPIGPAFRVNTTTAGAQDLTFQQRSVAMDATGDFVVVWQTDTQPPTLWAQPFDAAGVPRSPELRVSLGGQSQPGEASVAMDAGGNFVVAWSSPEGGLRSDLYVQRYTAAGVLAGAPQVVTYTGHSPSVAMDADGDFVVAWVAPTLNLFASRFDALGNAVGQVGVSLDESCNQPAVAITPDGRFVLTWSKFNSAGGIDGRVYFPSGQPATDVFQVMPPGLATRGNPEVAINEQGGFVVTWAGYNQDGDGWGVYAKRFDLSGIALGPDFLVNTTTVGDQDDPHIATDHAGNFTITWLDGSDRLMAQSYNATGSRSGSEFSLVTGIHQDGFAFHSDMAMDYGGNMAVVWDLVFFSPQQDSDVYAQRFGTADGLNTATGQVVHDRNTNGVKDAGELGLPGWTVFNDQNANGQVDTGSYTSQRAVGTTIPGFSRRLYVGPGPGPAPGHVITDVNVSLNLQYPSDSSLTATVISPGGRRVTLFSGAGGGSNANFIGTTLDDSAVLSVNQSVAPFTGTYRPQQSLSAFNGEVLTAKGYWMLEIQTVFVDPGFMIDWSVRVNHAENSAVTDAAGNYTLTLPAGTSLVQQVDTAGWVRTFPSALGNLVTFVGGGQTAANVDFGDAYPGRVTGWVFEDRNADHSQSQNEGLLDRWTVYADLNGNGRLDADEPSTLSDASAGYSLGDIPLGVPVSLGATAPRSRFAFWELSLAPAPVTLTTAQPTASGLLFGAFQRASIGGVKFNDLNADGSRQPGDPGLPGWRIFMDQDGDGVYDDGSPRALPATDVPRGATTRAPARSTVALNGTTGPLTHLDVTLDLSVPQDGTVSATLINPAGESAVLFENWPSANGDLHGAAFDDDADLTLSEGTPPYTGRFLPQQPLSDLMHGDANGNWVLQVTMTTSLRVDHATLNSWSLTVATPPEPSLVTGPDGTYAFTALLPGTYSVGEVPQPGWRPTVPQTPTQVLTIESGQDVTALDFGDTSTAPTVLGFDAVLYSVGEADNVARVTVTRQGRSDDVATVSYSTRAVTATSPADYAPLSGTLLFNPGEMSKDILVPVVNDAVHEGDELFVVDLSVPGNASLDPLRSSATVTIVDDDPLRPPPRVAWVFVGGPQLNGASPNTGQVAFRRAADSGGPLGHMMPLGNEQVRALPWVGGITSIAVIFDQDVQDKIDAGDLQVRGATQPLYMPSAFSYDPLTSTAVWTLPAPVSNDRLRLVIPDDAATGIAGLDGEWTDPDPRATPPVSGSSFPSGDGVAGGVFAYRLNVLAGDATGDGAVNALDVADIKRRLTRRPGNGVAGSNAYSIYADVNGDGVINALDLAAVKQRLSNRLPTTSPAASLFGPPALSSASNQLFASEPILG